MLEFAEILSSIFNHRLADTLANMLYYGPTLAL
jgi:hypothetical protein